MIGELFDFYDDIAIVKLGEDYVVYGNGYEIATGCSPERAIEKAIEVLVKK